MLRQVLLSITFIFFSFMLFAQSGTIKGIIKDKQSGETLIGANVKIIGKSVGATTDFEGLFEIENLEPGIYDIELSYISYKNSKIPNISVVADQVTELNVDLESSTVLMDEVVISARRSTSSDIALLSEVKSSQIIATGISANQILRTQDKDASSILRRVSGVSIQDNKFVIIRGLNERYNNVLLNNSHTPSTEIDSRSFAFDLIPANAIDRIMVYKSASAELPGEFSGGVIKIFTKSVPDVNSISFGFGLGYNSNTTGKSALSYNGGKRDWLGFDDGTRSLPAGFASREDILANGSNSKTNFEEFGKLGQYYNVKSKISMPDFSFNFGLNRMIKLGVASLATMNFINYSNSNTITPIQQFRYSNAEINENYVDNSLTENVRWGAMSNWSLVWGKHKIELKNLFNQIGLKETRKRDGKNYDNYTDFKNYLFGYESRSIYSGQLLGVHNLSPASTLSWQGGYGYIYRAEPDLRRFTTSRYLDTDEEYEINIPQQSSPTIQQAGRFFSELTENSYSAGINFTTNINTSQWMSLDNMSSKLNVGVYAEGKNRQFDARWFGLVNPPPSAINEEWASNAEKLFDYSNLSASGLHYNEGTNADDRYNAKNSTAAAYLLYEWGITPKLRLIGGVRGEYNIQQINSFERGIGDSIRVENKIKDILPSINVSYNFTDKFLVRAAFSKTVNRPELREMAPFVFYDFNYGVNRKGDVNIKTAKIYNYDLKMEWYPSKEDLVSVSFFYKTFKSPIEQTILYAGSGVFFGVQNAPNAYSSGIELEIRKSFADITDQPLLRGMSVMLNTSVIKSNVKASSINEEDRALQGQSPFIVNAGLFYHNKKGDFHANILYNIIGKRISFVGDYGLGQQFGSVYENARHSIDVNLSHKLNNRMQLKLSAKDILAQDFRFTQDVLESLKDFNRYNKGRSVNISVSYSMF